MAKTITAMLIGVAVSEGKIKSIDDLVSAYVPGLADAEYGKTSIRDLLHMSSGVGFSEIYDGQDDIARLSRDLFIEPGKNPVASVAQFNTRATPPGTKWHYASVETEILGLVLRSATASRLRTIFTAGSGTQSARRPTRPGPSITPARRSPSAALTRPCATTRVWAGCSRMTAHGKDAN
jgi:CubicO group peptidase (beta-lactamase class C family)